MTQRTLLIMRHGDSSWPETVRTDFGRPLSDIGQQQVWTQSLAIQNTLKALKIPSIDQAIISPAHRTQLTFRGLHTQLGTLICNHQTEDALYLASSEQYLDTIYQQSADHTTLLIIGHNPGLSDLVSNCSSVQTQLSPADCVCLTADLEDWTQAGTIQWEFNTIIRPFPLLDLPTHFTGFHEPQELEPSSTPLSHHQNQTHWYDLGPLSDFSQDGLQAKSIQTSKQMYPLLIITQPSGLYALYDECPHRRVPLSSKATLKDQHVICGWHQWAFSYKTGQHQMPTGICVPHYPIRVCENRVEIQLPL